MAELRWAQWDELRDYANHPNGNEDIGNRAMLDLWDLFSVEHDGDGTHVTSDFLVVEDGTYTGTGAGHAESLTNANLDILMLWIWRADTEYPVLRTTDMSNTKELGTNAFQANMITDISTTGQFTIGTDATVNANTVTYNYFVIGTV